MTLVLPAGTNLHGQTPTIVINASSISPPSRVPQDFKNAGVYTVTAADGSTRVYTVTVTTNEFVARFSSSIAKSIPSRPNNRLNGDG